ncbi:BatD family protein [Congregibacter sp.]|uniref:BatD family protein n=1 Tax=Congregibacter sp. TaxID=2744308 RepID=UPI003F6AE4E4
MTRKRSGKHMVWLVLSLLAALAMPAQAALNASLDRYNIAMGDSVRLSLRSDDGSDPGDADLTALREHFEILQSSSNISTRIINGERSQTRELTLELTPLREGSLVIPPFEVDGKRSEALSVTVGPEPTVQATDEAVIFEAEVDRSEVYVQGQLLLTLRVQQAVNLDSRSISELDIPNAYVETLGQNSFQRTINGRPWLVHEIRYAIFPESSGELVIPAQTFSGRIASGRRTLFDTRPSGRLLRRRSEELVIPVLPRPDNYPAATWLPSSNLRIEEQWSGPLDQLRIGDSITRTITITGEGLQGAQLPPIDGNSANGLRAYPDQPLINNVNSDKGVTGIRSDSLALVAVEDGVYELPALEIPWWDTETDSLKIARLPAQRLTVLPGPGATPTLRDNPRENPGNNPLTTPDDASTVAAASGSLTPGNNLWPWVTAFCAGGWLITTLLWWRRGQRPAQVSVKTSTMEPDPPKLLDACKRNDAPLAREALRIWLRNQGHRGSMETWLREQDSAPLRAAVQELERCLYRDTAKSGGETAQDGAASQWNGSDLATAIGSLPKESKRRRNESALPQLYLSQ